MRVDVSQVLPSGWSSRWLVVPLSRRRPWWQRCSQILYPAAQNTRVFHQERLIVLVKVLLPSRSSSPMWLKLRRLTCTSLTSSRLPDSRVMGRLWTLQASSRLCLAIRFCSKAVSALITSRWSFTCSLRNKHSLTFVFVSNENRTAWWWIRETLIVTSCKSHGWVTADPGTAVGSFCHNKLTYFCKRGEHYITSTLSA